MHVSKLSDYLALSCLSLSSAKYFNQRYKFNNFHIKFTQFVVNQTANCSSRMPYKGLTKFLLVIGFLSLLHAAYSAAQRKQIKSIEYLDNFQLTKINTHIISNIIFEEMFSYEIKNHCFILDRTYLRDTDQEKTNTFLPLDVSIKLSDGKSRFLIFFFTKFVMQIF